MKQEFWKHQYEILFFWPLMIILSYGWFITGIVVTIVIESYHWPLIFFGGLYLISCILVVFLQKKILCKVVFSKEEIVVKRLGDILVTIKWSDIISVEGRYHGSNGGRYMSFISRKEKIDVVPTPKMYKAIIALCPYPSFIREINSIDCLKCFHRKNN